MAVVLLLARNLPSGRRAFVREECFFLGFLVAGDSSSSLSESSLLLLAAGAAEAGAAAAAATRGEP